MPVSPEVPIVQSFISSPHEQNELSNAPLQAPSPPQNEMTVTESTQTAVAQPEPGNLSFLLFFSILIFSFYCFSIPACKPKVAKFVIIMYYQFHQ